MFQPYPVPRPRIVRALYRALRAHTIDLPTFAACLKLIMGTQREDTSLVRIKTRYDPYAGQTGCIVGELQDDPRWKTVLFMNGEQHSYADWELERAG